MLISSHLSPQVVVFLSNCDSVEFHHALLQAVRWPNARLFEPKAWRRKLFVHDAGNKNISSKLSDLLEKNPSARKGKAATVIQDLSDESDSDEDDLAEVSQKQKELEVVLGDSICVNVKLFKLHGNLTQADR